MVAERAARGQTRIPAQGGSGVTGAGRGAAGRSIPFPAGRLGGIMGAAQERCIRRWRMRFFRCAALAAALILPALRAGADEEDEPFAEEQQRAEFKQVETKAEMGRIEPRAVVARGRRAARIPSSSGTGSRSSAMSARRPSGRRGRPRRSPGSTPGSRTPSGSSPHTGGDAPGRGFPRPRGRTGARGFRRTASLREGGHGRALLHLTRRPRSVPGAPACRSRAPRRPPAAGKRPRPRISRCRGRNPWRSSRRDGA